MTLAEQIVARGYKRGFEQGYKESFEQGRQEGRQMGKIQALQEFLGKPQSSAEALEAIPLKQLEDLLDSLRRDFEAQFKCL